MEIHYTTPGHNREKFDKILQCYSMLQSTDFIFILERFIENMYTFLRDKKLFEKNSLCKQVYILVEFDVLTKFHQSTLGYLMRFLVKYSQKLVCL